MKILEHLIYILVLTSITIVNIAMAGTIASPICTIAFAVVFIVWIATNITQAIEESAKIDIAD